MEQWWVTPIYFLYLLTLPAPCLQTWQQHPKRVLCSMSVPWGKSLQVSVIHLCLWMCVKVDFCGLTDNMAPWKPQTVPDAGMKRDLAMVQLYVFNVFRVSNHRSSSSPRAPGLYPWPPPSRRSPTSACSRESRSWTRLVGCACSWYWKAWSTVIKFEPNSGVVLVKSSTGVGSSSDKRPQK